MNIDELEQIIRILKANDVTEFELENDGVHIRLSRGARVISDTMNIGGSGMGDFQSLVPVASQRYTSDSQPTPQATKAASAAEVDSNFTKVESPIVGTFYRKPTPDADPFVVEGQVVKKGDTLCIIEAMKIMNEIEAPCSGRIQKIFLSDGHVVEFGEVLFLIDPAV